MNEDLVSAKLGDYVDGEIAENDDLYPHTGVVEPDSQSSELLSFMESIYNPSQDDDLPPRLHETQPAEIIRKQNATDHVGRNIPDVPSFTTGVTDRDASLESHEAFSRINNALYNNQAPYIGVMFGSPNTGKTSLGLTYLQLWRDLVPLKYDTEEFVILSNLRSLSVADHYVDDYETFRSLLFGDQTYFETGGAKGTPPQIDPSIPVFWLFDECSTHLDARTHRHDVAKHYTPLVKRFAKVNVDAIHIAHSGLDIHPELRRHTISTEFCFKRDLDECDVYNKMNDDEGTDKKYRLENIPDTSLAYDPDDFSPWRWPD